VRLSWYAGIEQQQVKPVELDLSIQRPRWQGIAGERKCGPHQFARIVVAGNAGKRQLERRQQPLQIIVFRRQRRIRKIARDHHEIGRRFEFIQSCDAALKRFRGIDAAIGSDPGGLMCRSEICAMRNGFDDMDLP
jgi:hypothetical protein